MNRALSATLFLLLLARITLLHAAPANIIIHSEALHEGRINPRLFGNFVELLDDVAPSLWAEMLNDRSFEGVKPARDPFYFDGKPNFCDLEWNTNPTWTFDTTNTFNATRSAKITATRARPGSLTQSDLSLKRGTNYHYFSGWFRSSADSLHANIILKTQLPTGDWFTLASARLPKISRDWTHVTLELKSLGASDSAVFEIQLQGDGALWADKLSLMPRDNIHGFRHDVVDAIKDLSSAGAVPSSTLATTVGKMASAIATAAFPLPISTGAVSIPTTSASTNSANSAKPPAPIHSSAPASPTVHKAPPTSSNIAMATRPPPGVPAAPPTDIPLPTASNIGKSATKSAATTHATSINSAPSPAP